MQILEKLVQFMGIILLLMFVSLTAVTFYEIRSTVLLIPLIISVATTIVFLYVWFSPRKIYSQP